MNAKIDDAADNDPSRQLPPTRPASPKTPTDALAALPVATALAITCSSPRSRRSPRGIHRPQEGSLYDLMWQKSGDSLFIRPLCWTDLHSQLLGIRFVELPPCDIPKPSQGDWQASPRAQILCKELTRLENPDPDLPYLSDHVELVMTTLYPTSRLTLTGPREMSDLSLYFGGMMYPSVCRVQLLWDCYPVGHDSAESFQTISTRPADSMPSSASSSCPANSQATLQKQPTVAYISKKYIHDSRFSMFRAFRGPKRKGNAPVESLCALRSKRLVPSNTDEDALFPALFLAMAQARFYQTRPTMNGRNRPGRSPSPTQKTTPAFHDVKVHLITNDEYGGEFIVYTAVVTAAFLQRFHEPLKMPRGDALSGAVQDLGMRIEYTRVPFWPVLGLKERLGKALGKDLVGEFDEASIDMLGSRKRKRTYMATKREVLAERVNESFDETSSDAPGSQQRKGEVTSPPSGDRVIMEELWDASDEEETTATVGVGAAAAAAAMKRIRREGEGEPRVNGIEVMER